MKKILIQFPNLEDYLSEIEVLTEGRYEIVPVGYDIAKEELSPLLSDTEIIFGDITPAWLEQSTALKWMQLSWAGVRPYTKTDLPERIILTNAAGAFGVTIAEHAIGMLLCLARGFRCYYDNAKSGLWKDAGTEWALEGRRALVLGVGDIGSSIAKRLKAFDMEVTGFARTPRPARPPFDRIITVEELDEVIKDADAVFGALPETPHTIHLLNEGRLNLMKPDAIIVNVGRGSLIDTEALLKRLEAGFLYGVGLDVTQPEPLPCDHPLWSIDRVLITPHVAGIGFGHLRETTDRIWRIALANLFAYCRGEELNNIITIEKGY